MFIVRSSIGKARQKQSAKFDCSYMLVKTRAALA